MRKILLAIDDMPGRYDELARLLENQDRYFLTITLSLDVAEWAIRHGIVAAILLDRDMPGLLGESWVPLLVQWGWRGPTVITSTTSHPTARREMLSALHAAKVPAILCPADHAHCELEWLALIRGMIEGRRQA